MPLYPDKLARLHKQPIIQRKRKKSMREPVPGKSFEQPVDQREDFLLNTIWKIFRHKLVCVCIKKAKDILLKHTYSIVLFFREPFMFA